MSYRAIKVDGKTYEYSIGHTGLKFRGHNNLVPHNEIGEPITDRETGEVEKYEVTPATIKAWLENHPFAPPPPLKDYGL